MPRSSRTFIISRSDLSSTRSPLTQITPASGLSRPTISLRMVDFPAPLAPRKIFVWPLMSVKLTSRRMTFSSNASDTWSNTTIGDPGPSASSSSGERSVANGICSGTWYWCGGSLYGSPDADRKGPRRIGRLVQQRNQQWRQEEVDGDHRDRRRDHGVGRGPSDPLRAAPRAQADVTPDGHDDEAERERLDAAPAMRPRGTDRRAPRSSRRSSRRAGW